MDTIDFSGITFLDKDLDKHNDTTIESIKTNLIEILKDSRIHIGNLTAGNKAILSFEDFDENTKKYTFSTQDTSVSDYTFWGSEELGFVINGKIYLGLSLANNPIKISSRPWEVEEFRNWKVFRLKLRNGASDSVEYTIRYNGCAGIHVKSLSFTEKFIFDVMNEKYVDAYSVASDPQIWYTARYYSQPLLVYE